MMNLFEINMMILSLILNDFYNKPIRLKVSRYGSKMDRHYNNLCLFDKVADYDIYDNKKIKALVLALCANDSFTTQVYDLSDCIAITFERHSHKDKMSQYTEYMLFINK